MAGVFAAFIAALVLGGSASAATNVVVILTDDQRIGSLRYMPKTQAALVQPGVRYSHAVVPTSVCCPSRASVLTGLFAHETGVYTNWPEASGGGWPAFFGNGMEERTIAVALNDIGYRTALIGRYMNAFEEGATAAHVPPGWDVFLTWMDVPGRYFDYTLTNGESHGTAPEDYSTDVLAGHAVDFIRTTPAEEPLFLYYAPFAPHLPYVPAPRHDGMFDELTIRRPLPIDEDVSTKPRWVRDNQVVETARVERIARGQLELLQSVDDAVGSITTALAEAGRLEDTLIVYLSDNGFMFGEHRLRAKMVPYDKATRIPLVLRWDGHVAPGTVDSRLASNVDIPTTIASATGATLDGRGISLIGPDTRDGLVLEAAPGGTWDRNPGRPAYCGWRTRYWLYVRYADGFEELYRYRDDPKELENRAYRPRSARVKARMEAHAVDHCAPVPPEFAWDE